MSIEGTSQLIRTERIEALRLILEQKNCPGITYTEAEELARELISFFEALAEPAEKDDGQN